MLKKIKESCEYIKKNTSTKATTAIVLGSGLSQFGDKVQNAKILNFDKIPHFKTTTVPGHESLLISGKIEGHEVIILKGRVHLYEGHDAADVVLPVRVMATLGVRNLILTNASGGINKDYNPGDLVCISDHINLTGRNPLVGPNLDELGARFPDLSNVYNKELREIIQKAFKSCNIPFKSGVYSAVLGPSFETPAEVKMLKTLGGDLVGMSTAMEAIAAHHAGMRVAVIACVTNLAAGISLEMLSHEEVKEVASKVKEKFSELLFKILSFMN